MAIRYPTRVSIAFAAACLVGNAGAQSSDAGNPASADTQSQQATPTKPIARYHLENAWPSKPAGRGLDIAAVDGEIVPAQAQSDRDASKPGPGRNAQPRRPQVDIDPGGGGQGRQKPHQQANGRPVPAAKPVPTADPAPQAAPADGVGPAQGNVAAPQKPKHGVDPGGGGQGRQKLAAPAGSPDLALVAAFQLGTHAIPWGTSATIDAADAAYSKRGRCAFRFKYQVRNQGTAGAGASNNRIHRDAQAGPVLATSARPALAPGASASSSGHVLLAPGTWMLYVHADDPSAVNESDEANNLRRVRVTVEGKCA